MQNNNNSGVSEDEILNQFMEVALHAASEAGNLIAAAFLKGDKSNVLTKSCFTDLVTQTDERCEEVIKGIIKDKFPQHLFIGEEETSRQECLLYSQTSPLG